MNTVLQEAMSLFPWLGLGATLGVISLPHCAAMCGGVLACRKSVSMAAMQRLVMTRLLSYAVVGAMAGIGYQLSVGGGAAGSSMFRAFGWMMHTAVLFLALWMLCTGRFPRYQGLKGSKFFQLDRFAWLWGLMPCGVLFAVIMTAWASGGPFSGMAVMVSFGVVTTPALMWSSFGKRLMGLGARFIPHNLSGEARRAWQTRSVAVTMLFAMSWSLLAGHASSGLWCLTR